jgi:hypothetical protein
MSSMSVPSSMSSPLTSMFASLIPSTSTTDIPIGLGLMGEQVLNTLVTLPVCPEVCRRNWGEFPGLRWKVKITTMRWPASMSRSPSEYSSALERSLHVGNAPVPRELCGIRTDVADGPQLDAHTEPP